MKRGVGRLILFPVLVLLVAGVIKIRSERENESRQAALRVLTESWCAAAAEGEDLADRLPTVEPVLGPLVGRAIAEVCGSKVDEPYHIEVARGVAPHGGHEQSSHYATFMVDSTVDGIPRLVLSFARRNDRTVIIGYWTPGER